MFKHSVATSINYSYFKLKTINPQMISWLKQKEYISPKIVNEIITSMGQCVLCKILAEVRTALWFTIIIDEATDISHNEQMSLSGG